MELFNVNLTIRGNAVYTAVAITLMSLSALLVHRGNIVNQ